MSNQQSTADDNQAGLFDQHGRRIPPAGLKAAAHRETRRWFLCNQPAIDYAAIHARSVKHLQIGGAVSAAQFESRAEAILAGLQEDPATRAILNGVRVPFLLPKASYTDLGAAIETVYLKAVRDAYLEMFPKYAFVDHHTTDLGGKLGVAPGSRHERLLAAMAQDVVVGYFFPALLEYSVPAAIEQMAGLPEKFLLAGGCDLSATFVAAPDLLLRLDGYPPLFWMSGLAAEKDDVGYHYEAYGYNLTFNRRAHLGHVAEYWSSGLVVLG